MCGIAGIIHFDGQPIDREGLNRACGLMRHRGPDTDGQWTGTRSNPSVGLAAVRLAVRDPTPAADQPMHDLPRRYVLVYNGELYNHRELLDELSSAGESLATDGDTEVVLKACARWGVGALARFNGMWGLAFYDRKDRRGFIARDRFGIKPVVYATFGDTLCFASELAALRALGRWDRAIDDHALAQHLQFGYIAAPRTIHRGSRRLGPGCYLEFDADGAGEPTSYCTVESLKRGATCSYCEATAGIRHGLRQAVTRRRVSDVPIGAFLSGGLDSSIIVAHLSAAMGTGVRTFSVGHADAPVYDETKYARTVARRFGTDHYELKLTTRDIVEAVPGILDHLGEPVGDSSIIPTTLVSRLARRHVTVALSGDAGDELFGGYWRYLGHAAVDAYRRIPPLIRRRVIEPLMSRAGASKSSRGADRVRQFRKLLRSAGDNVLARHIAWSRIMSPEAESVYTNPKRAPDLDRDVVKTAQTLSEQFADDPLAAIFAFDLQYGLPSDMLHKVDTASMSCSLEVRVPFLDPDVVACALSIPSEFKIDRGLRKRVLIDAYRDVLPDAVLDRPKKGFEVPLGEYLRGPLHDLFRDTVTRSAIESFDGLCYETVERVFEEHLTRRAEHADLLFALLSLCWWRRNGE